MQNWHLSPPLFLLRIGKFFQPLVTTEGIDGAMKTLPLGSEA